MAIKWIRQILLFFLLALLQVWIFNKINLWGVVTPLFYVYFIIKLPINTNRNFTLFLSFLIGFTIDMLSYTPGFHALACTVAGFLRYYILNLFTPRDVIEFNYPSISDLGMGLFLRYAFTIVLIHHIVLFVTESFSLFDPLALLLRIGGSVILSVLFVFAADGLNFEKMRKRGE